MYKDANSKAAGEESKPSVNCGKRHKILGKKCWALDANKDNRPTNYVKPPSGRGGTVADVCSVWGGPGRKILNLSKGIKIEPAPWHRSHCTPSHISREHDERPVPQHVHIPNKL